MAKEWLPCEGETKPDPWARVQVEMPDGQLWLAMWTGGQNPVWWRYGEVIHPVRWRDEPPFGSLGKK